jgi:hypothetical protein
MIKVTNLTIEKISSPTDSFLDNPSDFLEKMSKYTIKFEADIDVKFLEKFKLFLDKELGLNKREKKTKE